jgi:hypothetical protein
MVHKMKCLSFYRQSYRNGWLLVNFTGENFIHVVPFEKQLNNNLELRYKNWFLNTSYPKSDLILSQSQHLKFQKTPFETVLYERNKYPCRPFSAKWLLFASVYYNNVTLGLEEFCIKVWLRHSLGYFFWKRRKKLAAEALNGSKLCYYFA